MAKRRAQGGGCLNYSDTPVNLTRKQQQQQWACSAMRSLGWDPDKDAKLWNYYRDNPERLREAIENA